MHPDEQPGADQLEVLRRMTPEQCWRAAHRLYWTLRRHKAAFLRDRHPYSALADCGGSRP